MTTVWAFILAHVRADDPGAAADIFVALCKKVFVAMVGLTGITVVVGYLAIVAAKGPQCPGYELILEYRPQAFAALAVCSAFMAFMVSRAAWPSPCNRERIEESFAKGTQIAHSDLSFEMTDGVLTAYVVLFSLCCLSVAPAWIAIAHYLTILNDCPLVTNPH